MDKTSERFTTVEDGDLGWYIYDNSDQQRLLGYYTKSAVDVTAKRLNQGVDLSRDKMRALKTLASESRLSIHSLYNYFRGKTVMDVKERTMGAIAREFESYGFARIVEDEVFITKWGLEWLGWAKR